jgi:hypothetical protein
MNLFCSEFLWISFRPGCVEPFKVQRSKFKVFNAQQVEPFEIVGQLLAVVLRPLHSAALQVIDQAADHARQALERNE